MTTKKLTKLIALYLPYILLERSNPNPNHCPLGHSWRQFHRK